MTSLYMLFYLLPFSNVYIICADLKGGGVRTPGQLKLSNSHSRKFTENKHRTTRTSPSSLPNRENTIPPEKFSESAHM